LLFFSTYLLKLTGAPFPTCANSAQLRAPALSLASLPKEKKLSKLANLLVSMLRVYL